MGNNRVDSNDRAQWLNTIVDTQLRREVAKWTPGGDVNDLIRADFVLLERRIRESAGLAEHNFGKDLIDKAFHPETGLLQPVSPIAAERAGLHHLLLGTFLYYRNPVAHRLIHHTEQSSRRSCPWLITRCNLSAAPLNSPSTSTTSLVTTRVRFCGGVIIDWMLMGTAKTRLLLFLNSAHARTGTRLSRTSRPSS
jgi:hypothetical protein